MKKHIYLPLVAIVILLSLSACNLAMPTSGQLTDGDETSSTLMFVGSTDDINVGVKGQNT